MPPRPTDPPRCPVHKRSAPCPQCKREDKELRYVGGNLGVARDIPNDPASFARDNAFQDLRIVREGEERETKDKVVQESTRQPSTSTSTYQTRASTTTSSVAATGRNSPFAQRPPTNTCCAPSTRKPQPAATVTQTNTRTMTQQQAECLRARFAQNKVFASRCRQAEDEGESSSEEGSEDEDGDDDESEDDE